MKYISVLICLLLLSPYAWSWGKRGHSIVCEAGAYLAADTKEAAFLKSHSLDFGYYCNVPDLIWKRPGTYKSEFTNHFMNLEAFERVLGKKDWKKKDSAFFLSRKEFNKKHPKIEVGRGRSWWRIREFTDRLSKITQKLKTRNLKSKKRKELQAQWIMISGIMGHYVGDLAMPLHVSENYDGQLSGQKGIHHYFEEKMVAELYLQKDFGLQAEVFKRVQSRWPQFLKKYKKWDVTQAMMDLSKDSFEQKERLLSIDKKTGRKNLEKSVSAFKELVLERLVQGALYQGLIFHKHLGWKYDGKEFFQFREKPRFIEPGH